MAQWANRGPGALLQEDESHRIGPPHRHEHVVLAALASSEGGRGEGRDGGDVDRESDAHRPSRSGDVRPQFNEGVPELLGQRRVDDVIDLYDACHSSE